MLVLLRKKIIYDHRHHIIRTRLLIELLRTIPNDFATGERMRDLPRARLRETDDWRPSSGGEANDDWRPSSGGGEANDDWRPSSGGGEANDDWRSSGGGDDDWGSGMTCWGERYLGTSSWIFCIPKATFSK